ncbi:hypothetical protein ACEW7V_01625 [Areca yellow leaf disease phytoplasma]|uniref:hypothetical protein n=1 Tax=Areca yellow leaf disease phytoplasma TaxID=927614 RepID=UPI0035B550B4
MKIYENQKQKLKSDLSMDAFEDIFFKKFLKLPVVVISEVMPIPNVDFRIGKVSDHFLFKSF